MDRRIEFPVVDQGLRGTCAACAVTSAHGWSIQAALSIEDAFWLGKQHDPWAGIEQTSVHHILEGIQADGHAAEHAWPYGQPAWPAPPPSAARQAHNRYPGRHWQRVGRTTLAELKQLLSTGAIVLTLGFVAAAWEHQEGLVHSPPGATISANHAVVAVGQSHFLTHDTLIIRNSWGTDWGDHGYGYVSASYLDSYLIDSHYVESAA